MKSIKMTKPVKTDETKSPVKSLVIGVSMAYAITAIVFIAYAILLTYTDMTEKNIPIVVIITVVFSVLVAGFDSARGAIKKGWLWGIGAGLIYAFFMILIGLCVSPGFGFDSKTVMLIVLSLAGGGLGGIVGINIKK